MTPAIVKQSNTARRLGKVFCHMRRNVSERKLTNEVESNWKVRKNIVISRILSASHSTNVFNDQRNWLFDQRDLIDEEIDVFTRLTLNSIVSSSSTGNRSRIESKEKRVENFFSQRRLNNDFVNPPGNVWKPLDNGQRVCLFTLISHLERVCCSLSLSNLKEGDRAGISPFRGFIEERTAQTWGETEVTETRLD